MTGPERTFRPRVTGMPSRGLWHLLTLPVVFCAPGLVWIRELFWAHDAPLPLLLATATAAYAIGAWRGVDHVLGDR